MYERDIIWAPLADEDLDRLLDHLDKNWGPAVSIAFLDELENCIELIRVSPEAFPVFYSSQKIRRCVVTKQNSLFFRVDANHIAILRLYDTRQDPNDLFFD
ncbi:MAG: type II toxin-antitoxin system RelE/ParE family toxin [Bacteroidetes bacterium]|nr:MAG: type II toxin-antitoxin system RelE/ParE family toxin [Bacteroidota bacterium]